MIAARNAEIKNRNVPAMTNVPGVSGKTVFAVPTVLSVEKIRVSAPLRHRRARTAARRSVYVRGARTADKRFAPVRITGVPNAEMIHAPAKAVVTTNTGSRIGIVPRSVLRIPSFRLPGPAVSHLS